VRTLKYVKWKRLSGAVITGYVVKEDKRFLYVKSDKRDSGEEWDFTIPQYAIKETPDAFEIIESPSANAFNLDNKNEPM
jgi:hypothetical protein